ncbi:MAG: hypothetical protein CMJ85_04665 [Planctomycetes bacterium]|nr:hypothetical protein [Planctomycetota bacterium]
MRRSTLTILIAAAVASASLAQGKVPPPKDDAEVPELIKTLKKVVKTKKGVRDGEGQQILDKLSSRWKKLNAKQQKAVTKAIAGCFKAKRKPDQVLLYRAAGEALSHFGRGGAKALAMVVEDRRFRNQKEWVVFRALMIRFLGRPAVTTDRIPKLLMGLCVKDNDDQARAKAGEALGDYHKSKQEVRKGIVKALVKGLEECWAESKANLDTGDLNRAVWAKRWAVIQDPWMKSLKRLTGQSFKEVRPWVKWWNKNKNRNWDKPKRAKPRPR